MFHQLLKALFFSTNLKHTLSLCMWNSKREHSEIRCRNFSTNNYFQNIYFIPPLSHAIYFSPVLMHKQQHEPAPKLILRFSYMFSSWLKIQTKCALLSLVTFFVAPIFLAGIHNPRMLVMVFKKMTTLFLFTKVLLKQTC